MCFLIPPKCQSIVEWIGENRSNYVENILSLVLSTIPHVFQNTQLSAFFSFSAQKILQNHILIRIWSVQHPNAGRKISNICLTFSCARTQCLSLSLFLNVSAYFLLSLSLSLSHTHTQKKKTRSLFLCLCFCLSLSLGHSLTHSLSVCLSLSL